MNPLISIIIPVYNRHKELMLSLDSIQKQTYRPLEVVIIDDGSSERITNYELRIKELLKDIPVILYRQNNQGAPSARNRGAERSQGEFFLFWDADIIGEPEMVEKMYVSLEKNKDASFAYSNFSVGSHRMRAREFDFEYLKKVNYITTMSLIRKKDFAGFDPALTRFQDWDLWLTLAEQGKQGVWVDEYLYRSVPTKQGISAWLPSFAYHAPWKYLPFFSSKVKKYEEAKKIILKKHGL